MVFESTVQSLLTKISAQDFGVAETELRQLIADVEAHYNTLSAGQKRQWDSTRSKAITVI